jgi:hypothetical protein
MFVIYFLFLCYFFCLFFPFFLSSGNNSADKENRFDPVPVLFTEVHMEVQGKLSAWFEHEEQEQVTTRRLLAS